MPSENETIHILVVDYDDCTFAINSPRQDSLSPALIAYVNANKFDGFYGCTHRSYAGLEWLRTYVLNRTSNLNYDKDKFNNTFPTYKITAHFSEATHLPCYAVSTMDDYVYPICGMGFSNVLKPYEESRKIADATTPYLSGYKIPWFAYYYGKNPQLLQIAQHANLQYPDRAIELTYLDDTLSLCHAARTATNATDWPKNVSLSIFQHLATEPGTPITKVTQADPASSSYISSLRLFGNNTPVSANITQSEQHRK